MYLDCFKSHRVKVNVVCSDKKGYSELKVYPQMKQVIFYISYKCSKIDGRIPPKPAYFAVTDSTASVNRFLRACKVSGMEG